MDERQFWVAIWKIICAVICVLTVSISGCVGYNTYRITESKDPLAAACAIGNSSYGQACIVSAGRK